MKNNGSPRGLFDYEIASGSTTHDVCRLRLYISGITPRSTNAVRTIKEICDTLLKDRYELEIIDVYQQPEMARTDQIVAVPTLLKLDSRPVVRLVGDMSDRARVLKGLNL